MLHPEWAASRKTFIIYAKGMQNFGPEAHSEEYSHTAVFGIVNAYFHYVPIPFISLSLSIAVWSFP